MTENDEAVAERPGFGASYSPKRPDGSWVFQSTTVGSVWPRASKCPHGTASTCSRITTSPTPTLRRERSSSADRTGVASPTA